MMSVPILVVEDDPLVSRAMSRTLKRRGHAVATAATVEAALGIDESFALGVFDIDLPDGDGVELARTLLDRRTILLAVFFSATTSEQQQAEAGALGVFVPKAEGTEAMVKAVEETLAEAARASVAAGAEATPPDNSSRPSSSVRRRR